MRVAVPHFAVLFMPVNREHLPHTCGEPNPGFQIRISFML